LFCASRNGGVRALRDVYGSGQQTSIPVWKIPPLTGMARTKADPIKSRHSRENGNPQ
jgi:hypothetical protein